MNKHFLSMMAVALVMVSLAGCDKIQELTSKDITVNNVTFDFSALTEANAGGSASMTRAETVSTFSETRVVDISEIGSAEVAEYASKISKVMVNSSLLHITIAPSGNYTVTNVKITAVGVSGSLNIPSYTIGSAFTPPSDMNTYTVAFITKLLSEKSLTVTVSGETDAPSGTTVTVSYESDLILTASLFN